MKMRPSVRSSIVLALAGGWFVSGVQPFARQGEAKAAARRSDANAEDRGAVQDMSMPRVGSESADRKVLRGRRGAGL
jgi:hypothetical protein